MTVQPIARSAPGETPSKATISALKAPPPPLQGRQASIAATGQGHGWNAKSGTARILEHAETAEVIDQRGDREMRTHLESLKRIARGALERGEYQTHTALQEEIARCELLIEWDHHEDYHRRAKAHLAGGVSGEIDRVNGCFGVLLGQAEAQCDLDDPHPLALCSIRGEP